MKKWTAMMLVLLTLVLSGCGVVIPGISGAPGQSEDGTVVDFDPENPPKIDFDAPALSVTVNMGPELELTLSFCNQILEANALNAHGETLLSGMELVGKNYYDAMTAILQQAKEQEFLQNETAMTVNIRERMEGVWNLASYRILVRPFDAFGEIAGITLNYELTPEVELAWEVAKTHTNSLDERDEVICYNSGSQQILNRYFYQNGDYAEHYYLSSGGSAYWKNDGEFTCYGNLDGVSYNYTLYPDGTRSTTTSVGDGNGNYVWYFSTSADGATNEAFFENGEPVRSYYNAPGVVISESFYEDGKLVRRFDTFPDGSTSETSYFYEDDEMVRTLYAYPDGATTEYFYENGECVRTVYTDADGEVLEGAGNGIATVPPQTSPPDDGDGSEYEVTYYENGNKESEKTTWPNGDYECMTYYEDGTVASAIWQMDGCYSETHYNKQGTKVTDKTVYDNGDYDQSTYHENGQRASHISQSDGYYSESHYDEDGKQLSHYQLDADGSEHLATYEHGVLISTSQKEANGDYSNYTYYENGSVESSVSYRDGRYSEDYYRENGSRVSSYWKDSNSEIKRTYDENDEMTSYEETFADGAWCLDTYENGKPVLSKGYGSDGLYWENVYDENGMLVKTIREVAPGHFVEDIIDPNEIPSSGT